MTARKMNEILSTYKRLWLEYDRRGDVVLRDQTGRSIEDLLPVALCKTAMRELVTKSNAKTASPA